MCMLLLLLHLALINMIKCQCFKCQLKINKSEYKHVNELWTNIKDNSEQQTHDCEIKLKNLIEKKT